MNYQQLSEFWKNLCFRILEESSHKNNWDNRINGIVISGSEDGGDGNPVFALVNESLKRGVRIIQEEIDDSSPHQFSVWMNRGWHGALGPEEYIEELVFSCMSHEEFYPIFSQLFTLWANPKTSYSSMERRIARIV